MVRLIKIFACVFLIMSIEGLFAQKECENFKNGVFEMYSDTFKVNIVRNDSIQISTMRFGVSKYRVKWLGDCEYDIELYETTMSFSLDNIGRVFHVKIIDVKDEEYSYECRVDGVDMVDTGTITKIE